MPAGVRSYRDVREGVGNGGIWRYTVNGDGPSGEVHNPETPELTDNTSSNLQ